MNAWGVALFLLAAKFQIPVGSAGRAEAVSVFLTADC